MTAALCFLGAYLSNHYGQGTGVLLRTDAARLQTLVTEAELTADRDAREVAERLQKGQLDFSWLVGRTTYPCFVFRGERLLYWSDHTTRPETENVSQKFREKLIDTKFGHFLALRRLAAAYTILTYVPSDRHSGISKRY